MMLKMTTFLTIFTVFLVSSCAENGIEQIVSVIENRSENDQRLISVSGVLKLDRSYFNLYSRNGKRCIGVLLFEDQKPGYKKFAGRFVTITGTLEAESCGLKSICVERLCGPPLITKITSVRLR